MTKNTLFFKSWRSDRFTWIILARNESNQLERLYRADIEGTVRALAPDDRESGKLMLYEVPFKSVPSRCRCSLYALVTVDLRVILPVVPS